MKFSKNRSLAVMIFGIILPEVVTYLYNRIFSNDFQFILQYITGFIIFFSSLFLFISSVRGLFKSEKSEKSGKHKNNKRNNKLLLSQN